MIKYYKTIGGKTVKIDKCIPGCWINCINPTEEEINYCEGKGDTKYQHYAARFAAKEAIFKAISELLDSKYDIKWTEIEILHGKNEKPVAHILKDIEELNDLDVSLSHIKDYATATCVAILNEKED